MDKSSPAVEAVRRALAAMSRAEVRELAKDAGLACSTVEKFRLGHITEPRLAKFEALKAAVRKHQRKQDKTAGAGRESDRADRHGKARAD
jgi:hypothetical protein